MNNFNNNDEPQETVRQTLERVWHEKEQPEQSSYVARNPLARGLPRETYIKSDRNYAWTNAKTPANNYTSVQKNTSDYLTPQKYSVIGSALTGFAEGIMGGAERVANGLTGGIYGTSVDRGSNNAYTNRQNLLQRRADREGGGNLNSIINDVIDVDSYLLAYYLGKKI